MQAAGDGRRCWREDFTAVACLAGEYGTARKPSEALAWKPLGNCLRQWGRDLWFLPWEVAARTSPLARQFAEAEAARMRGDPGRAAARYARPAVRCRHLQVRRLTPPVAPEQP